MSNVLIYWFGHNFLCKFGDVAEVLNWSIVLQSVSIKTRIFKHLCDMCSLETGWETAVL